MQDAGQGLGCMNLLEPRIAPEFSECGVTSGASSIPPDLHRD